MALIDKLKQLQDEKKLSADTIREEVTAWKAAVKELFDWIGKEFADLSTAGLVRFRREEIRRTEDISGSYGIEQLRMTVAGRDIIFEPVALWIIGAAGRVDLYPHGLRDHGYMLLRDPKTKGWKITPITLAMGTREVPRLLDRAILEQVIEDFIQKYPNAFRP